MCVISNLREYVYYIFGEDFFFDLKSGGTWSEKTYLQQGNVHASYEQAIPFAPAGFEILYFARLKSQNFFKVPENNKLTNFFPRNRNVYFWQQWLFCDAWARL